MKKKYKYIFGIVIIVLLLLSSFLGKDEKTVSNEKKTVVNDGSKVTDSDEKQIKESGTYTAKEDVAAYLNQYGHLPDNFITKKEAKKLGWVSSKGNLDQAAPGKSIGGDHFGNYEGALPEVKGRTYYECDINSDGGYRGAERIIYSSDGLIYYTGDHYKNFELLYGEE